MIRPADLLKEAVASAKSGPVASALTLLVVAAMVLTIMLTTGRTVGAEQRVLASIDSAGSRAILIRTSEDAGVTSDVLNRIGAIGGVEWSGAFSAARDATNALITDGNKVAARLAYTSQPAELGIARGITTQGLAFASPAALEQLGLPDVAGSIVFTDGSTAGIGGSISTPDYLSGFEPIILIPSHTSTAPKPVDTVMVVADTPELVPTIAELVLSVLDAKDPTKVSLQTSENLTELRGLIESQLGSFSRGLVLALLGLTGVLLALILFGLVMMRRKDFGRRRALGASRSLIISLLLVQTAMLTVLGIVIGGVTAAVILLTTSDPLPGLQFVAALALVTLITALMAAAIPAAIASRREPIRELRVP